MKILLVATEPSPGMIPFAATIINTLAEDDRFEVRCITVDSGHGSYKPYISDLARPLFLNYPTNTILKIIYKVWPFRTIKTIKQIVKEFEPDCIHLLTGDYSLAMYYKFHKDNRLCCTVHDLHPHEVVIKKTWYKILNAIINKGYESLHKHCINLTTSSRSQVAELKGWYKDKNILYTPFPTLMTPDIAKGGQRSPELNDITNYILFFGRVQAYKGLDLLIDAYKSSTLYPDCKLVIAGRGSSTIAGNNSVIHINRFIQDSEVKSLFENARAVVFPYISATMSGVLSISYYFKKLTILSDVPFFLDNKSDLSMYFKTNDCADLTQKLNAIANYRPKENSNAYNEIYSNEALSNAYHEFYKKAIRP